MFEGSVARTPFLICKGQELANKDKSPLKTAEELVEWLKAHQH
jgi:hypothetical protein